MDLRGLRSPAAGLPKYEPQHIPMVPLPQSVTSPTASATGFAYPQATSVRPVSPLAHALPRRPISPLAHDLPRQMTSSQHSHKPSLLSQTQDVTALLQKPPVTLTKDTEFQQALELQAYYQKMAEDYRSKYLDLEREFNFFKHT